MHLVGCACLWGAVSCDVAWGHPALLDSREAILALVHSGEFHHGHFFSGGGDGERDLAFLNRRLTGGSARKATSNVLESPSFGLRHFEVGEDDEEDEADDEDDENIGPTEFLKNRAKGD